MTIFPSLLYPVRLSGTSSTPTFIVGDWGGWLILTFLGLTTGDVTINGSNGGNPPLGFVGTKLGAPLSIANILNEASTSISTRFSIAFPNVIEVAPYLDVPSVW